MNIPKKIYFILIAIVIILGGIDSTYLGGESVPSYHTTSFNKPVTFLVPNIDDEYLLVVDSSRSLSEN